MMMKNEKRIDTEKTAEEGKGRGGYIPEEIEWIGMNEVREGIYCTRVSTSCAKSR